MFNFHNRHYIFRQSDGQIRDFCDMESEPLLQHLGRNGLWSGATVIARNVHQYFCAELDRDDYYHILFRTTTEHHLCTSRRAVRENLSCPQANPGSLQQATV